MPTIKSSLPQGNFFPSPCWTIPNTSWSMTGHSRALERTGFWIPELRMMLDAGVDLPTDSGASPKIILITHGHIDHMNALPMLLRHSKNNDQKEPPVHIVAPAQIIHRLQQYTQLSWAVKVDEDVELPNEYKLPTDDCRENVVRYCQSIDTKDPLMIENENDSRKNWVAVKHNQRLELQLVGKKKSSSNSSSIIIIHTVRLFHGLCSTVGYVLSEPIQMKKKLRPTLQGSTQKETALNIQQAKAAGEEIHYIETIPEQPKLAFVLDTTIDALMDDVNNNADDDNDQSKMTTKSSSSSSKRIMDCPTIIIECTYLEDTKCEEASKRGHIWWGGLLPFVKKARESLSTTTTMTTTTATTTIDNNNTIHQNKTWILVHFSLRYTNDDIIEFFHDPIQSKIHLETIAGDGNESEGKTDKSSKDTSNTGDQSKRRNPDLVLWLDNAPHELWIDSFVEE